MPTSECGFQCNTSFTHIATVALMFSCSVLPYIEVMKVCNRLFPDNKYSVFDVLADAAGYILLRTVSDGFNFQFDVHGKWIDPATLTGNAVPPK
ncbi:hypothetical protein CDAR_234471 [Caerostris darwini]|uniref:Uncharacterized protein n=1 Tax=Caerostris darwini TaxID=1538125 RepID=A0AAV4TL61_9ARAC|nr:hypothetical protein CDAR_234471 [Caerostris darwini]